MNAKESTPRRPRARIYVATAVAAVVVIAAVVLGVTLTSSPPLPILNASYQCVPGSLIPQLKPGQATTLTTSYGGFTATFHSVPQVTRPNNYLAVGVPFAGTLKVTEGSQTWTLPRPAVTKASTIDAMCVIAFSPEQVPGVMVEGYTGGAHCCQVPVVYLFDKAQNHYDKVVDMSPLHYKDPHAFDGNIGFIPKVVGRQVLLSTGDDTFDYTFGCYACSTGPIVLDSVGTDGLTDVTPQHPSLVAANAAAIWTFARKILSGRPAYRNYSPFGFLAPWVADECTLGRGAAAWSTVEQLQREGELSDTLYYKATLNHGSFVAHLHSFLLRNDYCTGQI